MICLRGCCRLVYRVASAPPTLAGGEPLGGGQQGFLIQPARLPPKPNPKVEKIRGKKLMLERFISQLTTRSGATIPHKNLGNKTFDIKQ